MVERYDYLATRLEERGATIAAEQPEWAKQLGDVPADPARREQWTQLAAEIDVFRQQYGVQGTEPVAIPDQYRERAVGADLAQRVTALHKSTQLSAQPGATDADRQQAAAAAAATAQKARDAVTTTTATTTQDARKAAAREQLRQAGMIGTKRAPADTGTDDRSAAAAAKQRQQQEAQRRAAQQRDRDRDRGRDR